MLMILVIALVGCGEGTGRKASFIDTVKEEAVPIYFFHDTACGNCDGTEEFLNVVSEEIAVFGEMYPYKLHIYNVFKKEGMEAAEKFLSKYEHQADQISYPAVLVHGKVYEGMEDIRENLLKAYLDGAESEAIYFYRSDCQECNEVENFIDSLPEKITIKGIEIPFELIQLDSREGDNRTKIQELFEKYGVPEEKQKVPFIFLKDSYMAGKEEIEKNLMLLLEQGHGLALSCEER